MKPVWGAMLSALLLGACTHAPERATGSAHEMKETPAAATKPADAASAPEAASSTAGAVGGEADAAADDAVPEVVNFTQLRPVLLMADDQTYGEYFTVATKVTYDINKSGRLSVSADQEPVLTGSDDIAQDLECSHKGGNGNQRTTWFSDTAIFVAGGTLQSVRLPGVKKPTPLRALTALEDGSLMAQGDDAREIEYAYVPCVAQTRVEEGHRIDGFAPAGTSLTLKTAHGAARTVVLSDKVVPFLLLRYHMGAMIPTPMRAVLITIDLRASRLVVYYQTTFAMKPPLRKIELRAIIAGSGPSEGESRARFEERTQAMLKDLAGCPAPSAPIEPCSSYKRRPNMLIFRSSLK